MFSTVKPIYRNAKMPRSSIRLPRILPDSIRWRLVWLEQHLWVTWRNFTQPEAVIAGITIPVDRRLSDNIRAALYDGYYEAAELNALNGHLDPNDRVMEVGAGIGLVSAFCAKQLGSERVFAYEANPAMAPIIEQLWRRNEFHPALTIGAVGATPGKMTFYVDRDFWSSSTIRTNTTSTAVTVPRLSMQQEINRHQPTVLIVDIEGGEWEALQGIDWQSVRKISIELHTSVIGEAKVLQLKQEMQAAGFRIVPENSRFHPGVKEVLFLERAA